MDFLSTYKIANVYQSFHQIDRDSYHTIIRFFGEHVEEIKSLDFEEYFEILVCYVNALFEAGAYQKHAAMADVVIEASIMNNFTVLNGINIFEKTLYQKASSLYLLHDYFQSAHILKELIRINPGESNYRDLLIKNYLQVKPGFLKSSQGLSIICYFSCVSVIAFTAFYLDPFEPKFSHHADIARNFLFIGGTLLMIGADGLHRIYVWFKVFRWIEAAREKIKRG